MNASRERGGPRFSTSRCGPKLPGHVVHTSYSLGDVLIELLPRPPGHDTPDAEAVVAVGEDAVAVLALAHLLLDDLHADAARLGRAGLGGGLRGPGLRGMGHIPSRISRPWRLQSC